MDTETAARAILLELRARVEAGGEGGLYGDRASALHELDVALADPTPGRVRALLLPTANLQELSIDGGWGSQFLDLAARLEKALGIG